LAAGFHHDWRQLDDRVGHLQRAFGYPVLPAIYILGASVIMVVLLFYKTQTAWPGRLIVLVGVPVYFWWRPKKNAEC
jgi:APA family basic amino acid/polyamine antiporter